MTEQIKIPNREHLEFTYVGKTAIEQGRNEHKIMHNLGNGTFLLTDAKRFGVKYGPNKPKERPLPMSLWDDRATYYLTKGYHLYSEQVLETRKVKSCDSSYKPMEDKHAQEVIDRLLAAANKVLMEQYTSIREVPQNQIQRAEKLILELAEIRKSNDIERFNNVYMSLLETIPRRIKSLTALLAKDRNDFDEIIVREEELLDMLVSKLKSENAYEGQTYSDSTGVKIRSCTPDEYAHYKAMASDNRCQFIDAWIVDNPKTRMAQERYVQDCDHVEWNHFFHGSGTQNWISLMENGLLIKPSGVPHCGSMWGNGAYTANKPGKSLGYTSAQYSCWANVQDKTGFIAVFTCASKKIHHVNANQERICPNSKAELQKHCAGADTLFAHAGASGLANDEIIFFDTNCLTIEALIEVKVRQD